MGVSHRPAGVKQAIRWRLLQYDPLSGVELPRVQRAQREVLDVDGARRFLAAVKGNRLEAMFVLALVTGMRPGEYLALQWGDIDFSTGEIRIQRSLSRIKGKVLLDEPKTPRSRRTVSVPTSVLELLKKHSRQQAKENKPSTAVGSEKSQFVFSTEAGTPLDLHNVRYQYLKPLLRKAGLPATLRLYDLRHACATILMMAGQNPKVVSERLGHASVVMTLDTYSHVVPVMQQQATAVLSDLLFPPAV
jgi:integrase